MGPRLSIDVVVVAIAALGVWNVVTWATYRLDKARARAARGDRRIPERTLLAMAAAGGSLGALIAVYGHRQRHKAKKLGFMLALWAIAAVQAGLIGLAVYAADPGWLALGR
jgi:uncharacterized membrane protein YsdA (DUF1294 family)